MSHRRRLEGALPPVYGRGSTYFSIEINHGGYFLGTGSNRSYVNGHSIWYDNVDTVTWSTVMLENIVEEIGYETSGRIKVYYCIPILTISRNGLRELRDDMDTEAMVTFVSIGNFFISLYLDHDERMRARDWDDVVQFPVADLPPVISPVKAATTCQTEEAPVPLQVVYAESSVHDDDCISNRTRQGKRKAAAIEIEEGDGAEEAEKDEEGEASEEADKEDNDSDFDPIAIVDSDFDISEADDDLFEDNGLINAVKHVFPDAEHRFCVSHLLQNFQQQFRGDILKNQLWKIARSSTVTRYEANMEYMKVLHPGAHAWLDEVDPKTWVRAFQSELPKCDVLLNNNSEVFNKYILEARELPVLSMFEKIKGQVMTRQYTKRKEEQKWPGSICPKIRKMVEKNVQYSSNCYVDGAGDGLFQVNEMYNSIPIDYVVDLKSKTCTC
ncbi:hypothetical protein ACQ4PT_033737 [Festuca glaucescens]